MFVTIDIFSGRPNPSWPLSDADVQQLLERFANRGLPAPESGEGVLGYRGLVMSAESDDQLPPELPASFRIGGIVSAEATPESRFSPLSAEESDDAARWLLSTGRHAVEEELLAMVEEAIRTRGRGAEQAESETLEEHGVAEPAEEREAPEALALPRCVIQNTPYNPGFWNRPAVQPHNNCYNYAMNYRSDTFAQPGVISGHHFAGAPTCANVGTAANWDGCHTYCSGINKNVALVIWPGWDYHWYRRHSEGFWGHKPGGTAARNTDNRGRVINGTGLTPQNCDRGGYTIFCGYRYSPKGMRVR